MLNKSTSRSKYVVQSGVTPYPIGFKFLYNGDDTPQIRVTIGDMVAVENVHFVITEDLLNIKLIPLEEEAPADPNDYSWMNKWVGKPLVIERDIPFVQDSDYRLGRISPEQIERDFDLSVMRDQELAQSNEDIGVRIDANVAEIAAAKARISANEGDIDLLEDKTHELENAISEEAENRAHEDSILSAKIEQLNTRNEEYREEAANAIAAEAVARSTAFTTLQEAITEEMGERAAVDTNLVNLISDTNNTVAAVNKAVQDVGAKVDTKQDELVAGENIKIEGNVISAEGGGGAEFPDQTDNAGKFLMTNGSSVSWGSALVNRAEPVSQSSSLAVGAESVTHGSYGVALGALSRAYIGSTAVGYYTTTYAGNSVACGNFARVKNSGAGGTAIGCNAIVEAENATQVGAGTNSDANTFKVSNGNGNFEMMSADGTVPTDRYTTTPTTAGTYVPKLTIAGDGTATREWGTESGGGGQDLSNYLQLSGGTMTGPLSINPAVVDTFGTVMTLSYGNNDVVITKSRYDKALRFVETSIYAAGIHPYSTGSEIGTASSGFKSVFVRQISGSTSYGDLHYLTVPNKDGTIATIEDINAIGGDGTAGQVLTKTDTGMEWQNASGGSGDTIQFEQLPTPSADYAGKILQYVGEDGAYKSGHFYKCVETADIMGMGYTMDGAQITVTVDTQKFLAQNPVWADYGMPTWRADGGGGVWNVWTQDPALSLTDDELRNTWGVAVNTSDGSPYTGGNASITVQNMGTTYAWIEVELGGGGAEFPDQTDNAGKFLMTDGSSVSWGEALANRNGGRAGSFFVTDGSLTNYATYNVAVGAGASSRANAVHVGYQCYDYDTAGNSVGIGREVTTYGHSIAIGHKCETRGYYAIQLGSANVNGYTRNSDAHTFKVGNGKGNFEMMDANGNIPLERLTYVTDQIGDISTALTAILGE